MNDEPRGLALRRVAAGGRCLVLGPVLGLVLGPLLSGCVGNPFADARVDPRSPVASEVARSVRPDAAYPTFASIPAVPKDLRPHRQYGVQAAGIDAAAAELVRDTADDSWTLRNTDAFAAEIRAAAGPDAVPGQAADTEAFAKELRRRATPPPSPKR
ncbi:hypothetical protein [Phenylobacterium sp.]|uniref:hypothetical protein n=1 Tax=Phenylobacterium sp. TaxID=1871053 RepID=UPI00286B7787|nr:hypothetical protein [Phenylobacterium sp.]